MLNFYKKCLNEFVPKKLKELAGLSIGLRQSLLLKAMEKYGLATINDVFDYIVKTEGIDISKANVYKSLKKTIENDLKSFTGKSGKLGTRYYLRDGITEVPIDQVEENKDGSVKNKYAIKYYLIGGNAHVHGAKILDEIGIRFIPQKLNVIQWKIEEIPKNNQKNRIGIIVERNKNQFVSIHASATDIPINVLIGRYDEKSKYIPNNKVIGNRCSYLFFKDNTISMIQENKRDFHTLVKIDKNKNISILDNSSNGTYYAPATNQHLEFIRKCETDIGTIQPKKNHLFSKPKNWIKVDKEIDTLNSSIFIKLGAVVLYIGPIE